MARRTRRIRRIKSFRKGGARKLSETVKNARKKVANVKKAEKALLKKQMKLVTAGNKIWEAAQSKLVQLEGKYNEILDEVYKAEAEVSYYKNELSYSDLQEV